MLYYLSDLKDFFGPLRIFEFITFRAAGALFTALLLTLLLGPLTIRFLHRFKIYSPGRLNGLVPEEELTPEKDQTPAMGGILIILSITVSTLLWGVLTNPFTSLFLATLLSLGGLGFLDDFMKNINFIRLWISVFRRINKMIAPEIFAPRFLFLGSHAVNHKRKYDCRKYNPPPP